MRELSWFVPFWISRWWKNCAEIRSFCFNLTPWKGRWKFIRYSLVLHLIAAHVPFIDFQGSTKELWDNQSVIWSMITWRKLAYIFLLCDLFINRYKNGWYGGPECNLVRELRNVGLFDCPISATITSIRLYIEKDPRQDY